MDDISRNTDRLHICVVTETYPPEVNGVAMTLQRFVAGLLQTGHSVSLVRPRQQYYDRPGCCNNPNVTLVRGMPLPGYHGIHIGLPAKKRLLRKWHSARPDVIYIATEGPLGKSALNAARRLDIPVVSGFHTNFHSYARHYYIGLVQHLVLGYLRKFHNQTAATLVPDEKIQQKLQDDGFRNVRVLTRGVDCDLFTPQRRDENVRQGWGANKHDKVLLYVGRLAAEKNIELFVRVYRVMRLADSRVKAVIIGDGPLYKKLQADNHDVVFCGLQRGKTLAASYASADLFVFPSLTETFGNVTLEAMASGLAVLAFDYAAASQHIRDGVNGYLVQYGDEKGFVSKAVEITKYTDAMAELRQRARTHVKQHHWGNIVTRFTAILRDSMRVVAS